MSAPQAVDAVFLPDFPTPVRERRLTVVPATARRRAPRRVFGVIAVLGALAIVLVQMGLGILTTQSSFEISSLTQQQRDLTYQKQILSDESAGLSSPQYLAANAAALGMVIDESPTYLRLSDGAVIGSDKPADTASSVDAKGRGSVGNALISGVPLVTDPAASTTENGTSTPAPAAPGQPAPTEAAPATPSATPPPISDGLPTPATR
ncbi:MULTISPECIES: hypothetical protein [Microbacterium]|uniref:Cell division protein FtsL n=1 Tax=Microbacterium testaceum TaxID=2033 RepID=A0A4Y3QKW6_MICTE|nr:MULTISPECIES: hypothetical protein [Microbacterium]MDZ5143049.1 hypothetical protein [Microbacterium testaceum]PNW08149.1 hypothetical protein C1632_15410 [Microbacterium testaceum]REC99136.1 hypothetical protein DEU35_0104 [Microbacterium sp. AG157]WJS92126.1 hypothetical protein NYQ11_06150 [Microbacterium testaceum]GEB44800.1 hypothetical protein MTE01_07450 [Microbacterium testaceum]